MIATNLHGKPDPSRLLFQTDPRLKLLLAIVAIVGVFSTFSWSRLILLFAVGFFLLAHAESVAFFRQRIYWLRWFVLFVILLHLLLTPGHTLFGVAWLSYDGLLHGLFVSLQMVTAVAFSLVLSRSTSIEKMTSAAEALLRPLNLFGINVKGFLRLATDTLHFVPVLKAEGEEVVRSVEQRHAENHFVGFPGRLNKLKLLMTPLLYRLADRADVMAHESASESFRTGPAEVLPMFRLNYWPNLSIVGCFLFVALIYQVLP